MSTLNQYGLGRSIPEEVKRTVRQRCGFGCVICATAIVEYEHVDPDFARARRHTADGIALLCPTCHAKKTRNFLSRRRVVEAMHDPAAKKAGFAFSDLESTNEHPYVVFAGMTLRNCATPVEIRGLPVLKIEAAEASGGPYRLSASFFDARGRPSLFIRQNEWQVLADTWDVEATGGVVIVRSAPSEIALRLRLDPGAGVVVERLAMFCGGYRLDGDTHALEITSPGGGKNSFVGGLIDNCAVGLSLN
jgi:hypothetical protein